MGRWKPRTVRVRKRGGEAMQCYLCVISLVTTLQGDSAAKKHSWSIARCVVQPTGFLQEAYKENHISEQFLVGRKEGVIHLLHILLSLLLVVCISHCRKLNPCTSRGHHLALHWSGWRCGILSKPGSWGVGGIPTKRKRRTQSRDSEKHMEFVSNIPLKDSMQEGDVACQRCGEEPKESWEWMCGKQLPWSRGK